MYGASTWQKFTVCVLCTGGVGVEQVALLQRVRNHAKRCKHTRAACYLGDEKQLMIIVYQTTHFIGKCFVTNTHIHNTMSVRSINIKINIISQKKLDNYQKRHPSWEWSTVCAF